nr:Os06g0598850 [Ipomoea batatas]
MFGKINGNKPSTATHSTQVEALNTAHKLVTPNNHGGKRWRRVKHTGIHHNYPNILRLHPTLIQHLINASENRRLRILPHLVQTRLSSVKMLICLDLSMYRSVEPISSGLGL